MMTNSMKTISPMKIKCKMCNVTYKGVDTYDKVRCNKDNCLLKNYNMIGSSLNFDEFKSAGSDSIEFVEQFTSPDSVATGEMNTEEWASFLESNGRDM